MWDFPLIRDSRLAFRRLSSLVERLEAAKKVKRTKTVANNVWLSLRDPPPPNICSVTLASVAIPRGYSEMSPTGAMQQAVPEAALWLLARARQLVPSLLPPQLIASRLSLWPAARQVRSLLASEPRGLCFGHHHHATSPHTCSKQASPRQGGPKEEGAGAKLLAWLCCARAAPLSPPHLSAPLPWR